jgi:hypothetical protein
VCSARADGVLLPGHSARGGCHSLVGPHMRSAEPAPTGGFFFGGKARSSPGILHASEQPFIRALEEVRSARLACRVVHHIADPAVGELG